MTDPWLFSGAPEALGSGEVTVVEGTTFCVSDHVGNMSGGSAQGLFVRDTRMLSGWQLSVAGQAVTPLTVYNQTAYEAVFVGSVPAALAGTADDIVVVRRRYVGNGMREEISVHNTGGLPAVVDVTLRVGADFADVFEVKDGRADARAERGGTAREDRLEVRVVRDGREYGMSVAPEPAATRLVPGSLTWRAQLPAHGHWLTNVEVVAHLHGQTLRLHHPRGVPVHHAEHVRRRQEWLRDVPVLETGDSALALAIRQSVEDLATLRIYDPDRPQTPVVAAGAPWFMALFGRDSLLTSILMLPWGESLALGTVATLSAHQGERVDLASEEEPGRILHELRFGPTGTLALGGRSAYYGTADATALFVVLVGEVLRWAGPAILTPECVAHVDRALDWLLTSGDLDGDGFVEYHRKTGSGLVNQGWKDSWDGVNFADGRIAEAPIALAEVQGYAYAAFRARAAMAEALADRAGALAWDDRATALKARFNEAFWLADRGWYAIGLDRDKRPIDALTSNNGHVLWSGIAEADQAASVASRLLSPEMFTGWGIRTLASTMGAFNPMSYHNGSVWPHDTAICVGGLARYGYVEEAAAVAVGLLDASAQFSHRLPELFAGFSRDVVEVPVPYPAACTPQAWAAAAPVELLRALLRLEPRDGVLHCDPALPERLLPLRVSGIRVRGDLRTVEVDRDGARVR